MIFAVYGDDWEDCFFAKLCSSQADSERDDDPEEGQFDLESPPAKITRFQYAISSLEAVQIFLDSRGYPEKATSIATATNRLTYCHCESLDSARQSTPT